MESVVQIHKKILAYILSEQRKPFILVKLMEQKDSEHCLLGCNAMYFTNILEAVGACTYRLEAPVKA
jgi:hypothetical protein